jgi:hypothetical protein
VYGQVVLAGLAALTAAYLAIATHEDINGIGSPSLEGATVAGFAFFAACAATWALAVVVAVRRAHRGNKGARWLAIACETVVMIWLAVVAVRWLSYGTSGAVWLAGLALTIGSVPGLMADGHQPTA